MMRCWRVFAAEQAAVKLMVSVPVRWWLVLVRDEVVAGVKARCHQAASDALALEE